MIEHFVRPGKKAKFENCRKQLIGRNRSACAGISCITTSHVHMVDGYVCNILLRQLCVINTHT